MLAYDLAAITSDGFTGAIFDADTIPALRGAPTSAAARALGSTRGLSLLSAGNGMVAYSGAYFATGWLPGAILGAFLADTDDTDLVSEVAVNEKWDYADRDQVLAAGWSENGATVIGVDSSAQTITIENIGSYGEIELSFAVVPGRRYFFRATTPAGGNMRIWDGVPFSTSLGSFSNCPTEHWFTPSVTMITIWRGIQSATPGGQATLAAFSIDLADADRSVNNKGLIVNGTITRSPVATGAELVGYSGFRSNLGSEKYLIQPYNPDLNFGTGDFSAMFWVLDPGGQSTTTILQRQGVGGGDPGLNIYRITSSASRVLVMRVGIVSIGAALATQIGVWTHVTMMRRNGELSIYLNGKLSAGGVANTYDVTSDQPMYFGVSAAIGGANEGMRYALLRISSTAPTPDQIAKIYEDERKLFMPGAQCTLYGTSDAVTALAHDPKTNLLHVGTAQSRSVFDGLLRVANTETPVTTAISAVGGMIAEQ
jgi:hypothetical protein